MEARKVLATLTVIGKLVRPLTARCAVVGCDETTMGGCIGIGEDREYEVPLCDYHIRQILNQDETFTLRVTLLEGHDYYSMTLARKKDNVIILNLDFDKVHFPLEVKFEWLRILDEGKRRKLI